jgi:hypothetical protein
MEARKELMNTGEAACEATSSSHERPWGEETDVPYPNRKKKIARVFPVVLIFALSGWWTDRKRQRQSNQAAVSESVQRKPSWTLCVGVALHGED